MKFYDSVGPNPRITGDIKRKAGGRYAADLVLQLPARGSGSVALHCGY